VAITSAVWPAERRGYALGILAGASAFFAAAGPVLGGLLTVVSWRLVFGINVPLAVVAVVLTLAATPALPGSGGSARHLDWLGVGTFALAVLGLVYGLSQGQPQGWGSVATVAPLAAGVLCAALFVVVELRVREPLIEFRLFRNTDFVAANISQALAGAVELGLGFLLPFFYLLVVGIDPVLAGVALIPGTLPIIAAGPLAGRLYDRFGGRWPLIGGFLVLTLSGLALARGAGGGTAWGLVPGLVLQGIGLGVVLTVNDPVGMNAVREQDRGQAAGVINTTEQLGGAIGIAVLGAVELGYYYKALIARVLAEGIAVTPDRSALVHDFIARAEQEGLRQVDEPPLVRRVVTDLVDTHIAAFRLTFTVSAGIALLGALACVVLVRGHARTRHAPVIGRRSRWIWANQGRSPALTREPPEALRG
jgi:MFS family permease